MLHFLRHLQGQIGPPVKHGQQHAVQFQPGIQGPADDPHRVHQIAEALQSVVFALHRHQDGVRGAEGVQRQQFQRGGAVDEQEVVAIFYLVQRVPQKEFPALHADQFDPGAGQRLVGGENIAVFGVHQGVLHRHFADQGIVDSLGDRLVHAHSRSGIGLRIKITQEDALPGLRQGRGEIHTGGCFPHAAFLIHNRNGFCHVGTYFLKIPNKVEMLMLIYYSKRGRPLQGEKRKSREKEEKMFHVKQTAEKEPRMFHVKHPQPVTAKDGSPRAAAASAEHRRNREEYLR